LAESKKPESRGKKDKKSGPSWNTRLTKAELVLALALFSEALLNPWLYSRPELSPPVKTLIKMAIIAGCLGPIFNLVEWLIDHSINATHQTVKFVSAPRVAVHVILLTGIFVGFYWSVNKSTPWQDYPVPQTWKEKVARVAHLQ